MTRPPISLLYFSNELARGGAEEHVLTLLRGVDRKYFRLHLVCPVELMERLRGDVPGDVELLPLCLRKPTQWSAARRLARILREKQVGILHSHLFYGSLFASTVGWFCRVPVILETPHVREEWRKGWLKTRYSVDRFFGHCVDRYIGVSEANARYLMEVKGLPRRKITVIHNGCNLERFDPNRAAPAGLKQKLGFGAEDPVLLVVGRLEAQKGHRVLLGALPAVRQEFPRVRLVCLGTGGLQRALEAEAQALGVEDAVRFVGFQSNVADWLSLADLSVLPSFYEGLPLAAVESLAAGRPVVATVVDGTPEVVVDGKTGFTVPPGDPRSLAEALCRILRDPGLRQRMGQEGRRWACEHFDQKAQVSKTQELYLREWEEAMRARGLAQVEAMDTERAAVAHTTVAGGRS
jgi:glycosyltransferase involved in cell wall biosynthesis